MEEHQITYQGIVLDVSGTHEAGEPTIMYNLDIGGHPGTPQTFELSTVSLEGNDEDIYSWLKYETIIDIERTVIEKHYS